MPIAVHVIFTLPHFLKHACRAVEAALMYPALNAAICSHITTVENTTATHIIFTLPHPLTHTCSAGRNPRCRNLQLAC
jgi:hypothetical protein